MGLDVVVPGGVLLAAEARRDHDHVVALVVVEQRLAARLAGAPARDGEGHDARADERAHASAGEPQDRLVDPRGDLDREPAARPRLGEPLVEAVHPGLGHVRVDRRDPRHDGDPNRGRRRGATVQSGTDRVTGRPAARTTTPWGWSDWMSPSSARA